MKLGVVFQIHFGSNISEGKVAIGKLDGKNPSLACATTGGRVMVHTSTKDAKSERKDIEFLNIKHDPTTLAIAPVLGNYEHEHLLVGSQTTVMAYDVVKNRELFYKETTDPVMALAFGPVDTSSAGLTLIGGNCSVLGFDAEGTEHYWTVTGDIVSALMCVNWTGSPAIVAASEDFELRAFRGEEVLATITEAEKCTHLHAVGSKPGRFAYSLSNGTVGMYQEQERAWRFKSKNQCTSLATCDMDFDGVDEVLCGWNNGKLDVRADGSRGGESVFKETYSTPVSAIVTGDYRMDGRTMPLICTYDGEVRGLVPMETSAEEIVDTKGRSQLEELLATKQSLQFEITSLDKQIEKQQKGEKDPSMPSITAKVTGKLRPNAQNKCIDLILTASEGTLRSAVISAELIFPGCDSAFFHSDNPTGTLSCPLTMDKFVATDLQISAMVGARTADIMQVHDISFRLPKFAMFIPVRDLVKLPTGFVTGLLPERISRFQLWASQAFNVPPDDVTTSYSGNFVSVKTGMGINVSATDRGGKGEFTLRCDSIEVCGEMLQDLATFLGITELPTTADFPTELDSLQKSMSKVDEHNNVRMKLSGEMADSTQLVKALVIKAEDSRILADMKQMKRMYANLYEVNRELMGEYLKRSNNHNALLSELKDVNNMIQRAANLRMGKAKSSVVAECRKAIKENDATRLFNVIRNGAE